MKSEIIGAGISEAEILNVSPHGFWIGFGGREYFLDFARFPWFRAATLEQLFAVEVMHGHHFHWPALDVDLDLDRIANPEKYPLVARS
jgi:hypothetical protein